MKALVLEENAKLTLHSDWEKPNLKANEVLVKVKACGVCGSDLPRGFNRHAYHYPLVMGHEFSGTVSDTNGHDRFEAGDRVVVFPLIPCKKCSACAIGEYAQCSNYDYLGSRSHGAYAEYVRAPIENVIAVPDHVDLSHASMTEPAAVALHGIRKLNPRAGESALVIGAGPIGNMAAQWLKIHGVGPVFIADVDEKKLAIAREMGIETINAMEGDTIEQLHQRWGGKGVHMAIEACGLPITFNQALQAADTFGRVLFMGNIQGSLNIEEKLVSSMLRKELSIHGTWNSKVTPQGSSDWDTVLEHMDRDLIVGPLISDRIGLEDGMETLTSMVERKKFHNKVIFELN
jgi:L-iditol 2-dehydrogenase